ncbi:protein ABHD18 [Halyomorpha halys]|uniref:protein ABHD18 n=1 Tax=Halyomorpha halys TaxID=286706 RepID=UPI0006D51702|nr:protein ABHD18 [Halyomorpha halys]XP_014284827.1 protein ABHD18 [Halyomorpha halys]
MTFSKLDRLYRSILLSRYFIKGWGTPENLKRLLLFRKVLSNRNDCFKLVGDHYPIEITKDEYEGDVHILEGHFYSPFNLFLPTLLPKESKEAHFQMILPKKWKDDGFKPVCIHMAGTGDHYFWRRRHLIAKPLLREAGIGSIILENPFYGIRKPVYQMRSVLNNVSDIFVMGGCLILEALVLFHWCTKHGFGPLGVSGLSMGGHMASLAATNWPLPLVLVPCLSWSTASGVFTEGVMSRAINWDMLEFQYKENEAFRTELNKMVQIRESDAFQAGKEFVKNFPESMLNLKGNTPGLDMKKEMSVSRSGLFPINEKLTKFLKVNTEPVSDLTNLSGLLEKVLHYKYIDRSPVSSNKQETINFMRGIMDECTHLKNFSVPVDTSLIISVCARDDGYVPRDGVTDLSEIWPGADVRFIDAGHVSAFVLHQKEFRQAIIEAFQRYRSKYKLH